MRSACHATPIRFDHLERLSGPRGIFEHARHDRPRRAHGYTTDDNARVLVVLGREHQLAEDVRYMFDRSLRFVLSGRMQNGWHNRMGHSGRWLDRRGSDDAHGRALWGLGVGLATVGPSNRGPLLSALKQPSLETSSPRANSYAALGLATALEVADDEAPAIRESLSRIARRIPGPNSGAWAWPEPRLAYANARIPEALIAAGVALEESAPLDSGLQLLRWLVEVERREAPFSFTPVGGRGPGDVAPAFDQQPIEAWAMADACARAAGVTDDPEWKDHARAAALWFLGHNDAGLAMYDPETGAGFDGLHASSVNANRGAESTLSALGALQSMGHVGSNLST